jgi:hypothetical protein
MGSSLNALKLKVYLQTSATVPTTIRFTGWNYCPSLAAWIPQTLLSITSLTFAAQTTVTPLATLGALTTATLNPLSDASAGSPNGALLLSTTGTDNQTILLNTRGCEFVQVTSVFTPGTAGTLTILYAGL